MPNTIKCFGNIKSNRTGYTPFIENIEKRRDKLKPLFSLRLLEAKVLFRLRKYFFKEDDFMTPI